MKEIRLIGYDRERLRDFIIENGCFTKEENLKIFENYFAKGPRYLFQAVDKKYNITSKLLCDIGCSYGMNLIYCTPDSYGIEVDRRKVEFARGIGLKVYELNLLRDDTSCLPRVDIIWCSAVLEHLDSPYIFLTKIREMLKPDGLLAIYVPTIPIFPSLSYFPYLGKYVSGFKNKEHIYAFVPSTLRFICERAGFMTIENSPFYPSFLGIFNRIPIINRIIGRTVYIGKKDTI